MPLRKPLIPLLCLFALSLVAQNRLKPYEEYIAKYSDIACNQQKIHGVPASIILAQGLLESGAGNSSLAQRSNNHFGIKCHASWTGDTVVFFDDGVNSCFRKYNKPEESFNDHSLFLVKGRRYASLFSLDVNDYKSWAIGLRAAGYATDPEYASKLIRIIETYDLDKIADRKAYGLSPESETQKTSESDKSNRKEQRQAMKEQKAVEKRIAQARKDSINQLDRETKKAAQKARKTVKDSIIGTYSIFSNEALYQVKDYQATRVKTAAQTINPLSVHEILYVGTTPYVKAQYGDSFHSLAEEFGLSELRIRRLNEFPINYRLKSGEPVYLDTKTSWWEGEKPYHVVEKGETMHSIAQKYALKLDDLFKMNNLAPGNTLKLGMKLKLRNPEQMSPIVRAINDAMNKKDSTNVTK
jgi:hypothetical protein